MPFEAKLLTVPNLKALISGNEATNVHVHGITFTLHLTHFKTTHFTLYRGKLVVDCEHN